MNLFVRYFDRECLAKSIDEAMDFLKSIEEIKLDNNVANRISTFLNSSNLYPFRLKVSYSNYVLFLKTEAETIEQFKEEEQLRKEQRAVEGAKSSMAEKKKTILDALNEEHVGWYDACITFKRVVLIPQTQKFQYIDTRFRVKCKAVSAMDCYNRMMDHLKGRKEIDKRSQFPSAKSPSFEYKFLGEEAEEVQ
ncbi:MAG: hypothetical protein KBT29_05780 [Prevotellaceae bacterium]|nr:hypothetical protein [Candidatus Minthosoma caballi]